MSESSVAFDGHAEDDEVGRGLEIKKKIILVIFCPQHMFHLLTLSTLNCSQISRGAALIKPCVLALLNREQDTHASSLNKGNPFI